MSLHPRSRSTRSSLSLLLLLLVGLVLPYLGGTPTTPVAEAQISNSSSATVQSLVDCIRMASDFGEASDARPRFAITCFSSAWDKIRYEDNGNPLIGDAPFDTQAVVEFGDGQPDGTNEPNHIIRASVGTGGTAGGGIGVGAVYGLAFSSGTNPGATSAPNPAARASRLFTSAFTKRITRYGSGGPGAIYVLNRNTNNEQLFAQVPNVVPGPAGGLGSDGSRADWPNSPMPYTPEMGGIHGYEHDDISKPWVTRTSLGDLELEPSERYLAVVNLYQRNIYVYDTWATNPTGSQFNIPMDLAGCPGGTGNFRPFSLAFQPLNGGDAAGYVGYVCSAETTGNRADLRAGVLRWVGNPVTWARVIDFPLAGFDAQRTEQGGIYNYTWQPWSNNFMDDQPILGGIEIAENGDMIIGLRDRTGDVGGTSAAGEFGTGNGDMVIARWNGTGWNAPTTARPEHFVDGGYAPENYYESIWGATSYVPGNHNGTYGGEVVASQGFVYREGSGGAGWFDISTGARTAREEIYPVDSIAGSSEYFLQKSAGLGDIELLCAWRAIGNRVWRDTNGNGIQDAGEPSINGVRLQLLTAAGADTGLAVTTGSITGSDDNFRFYVPPFRDYQVRIDPAMFNAGQPLFGMGVTLATAGSNAATDSNADANGLMVVPGGLRYETDIRWDIGLVSGADVTIAKSGPAAAAFGSNVAFTLTWANNGPGAAQNVVVQDTLPADMTFVSASPAPSSVSGKTLTWNLGTLAAGQSGTITVTATATGTASVQNCATITTTTTQVGSAPDQSCHTPNIQRPGVSIVKSGPATATVGAQFAYTLAYQSTGTATAANVVVEDTLPAGLSFVSATPAPSSVSGQVLRWNLGDLATGTTGSITVQVQSSSTAANGTVVVNTTTITTTTGGDDPGDNTSTTTTTLQRADVRITKSSPTTFPAMSGSTVTYYLDYTNLGPAAAAGVNITDNVPSQLANVSWSCTSGCTGSGTGNAISLNLGTLAAGASGRITVTGTAQTTLAREDFTNTARITTSTPETDSSNNESSVPGAVWTLDLQVIKTAAAQTVAGATFTATLTYRNNGPAPATAATLVDTLPAGVSLVSATPAQASVSGQTVTWNLGNLADQATGTINLVLRADPATADGTTLTNVARINTSTNDTDRDTSNNQDDAVTVVLSRADVQVVKTGPARVDAGANVDFTITYRNNGPSLARGVVVEDTLPSELALVSTTPAATTNTNGVLTWNVGDLAPGASGTITVRMQSSVDQFVDVLPATNQTRISTTTTDETPGNNTDDHTTNIETVDVSVVKDMPEFIVAGLAFPATIVVRNAGPATAQAVTLRDLLPQQMTLVSSTPAATGPGARWNLGAMTAGQVVTLTLQLRVASSTPRDTSFTNTAIVDTTSSDRDTSNNISTDTTIVRPNADVSLTKDGPAAPVRSGDNITYTLTYRNAGPSLAESVVVTDTLPAGFTLGTATPAADSNVSGVLTWNVGDLDAGESGTITLVGRIVGSGTATSTQRVNVARASSTTDDPDPDNNDDDHPTTVLAPDLQVTKDDGLTLVRAGQTVTYTVTVRNVGLAEARGVVLTETPPAGATITSTGWTGGPPAWTYSVGTLAAGASRTVSVVVRMPAPFTTPEAVNTVAVRDDGTAGPDPTPDDNTDTDTDTPLLPDLRVTKTDGRTQVQPTDTLTYTITVENVGPVDVTGVVLTETPPAGVTLTGTGWVNQNDGTWRYSVGTLAAGAQRAVTAVVRVPNPLPSSVMQLGVFRNTVTVTDDGRNGDDPTPGDNTSTDDNTPVIGSVGDLIWFDKDEDGTVDSDEQGIPMMPLQLIDPDTLTVLAATMTNANGNYLFDGLRLGRYAIRIDPAALASGDFSEYRITTDPIPVTALTTQQREDLGLDIGLYNPTPTAVVMAYLKAERVSGGVAVRWGTLEEQDTSHFEVYRSSQPDRKLALNLGRVESLGSAGGDYTFTDANARVGQQYYYWVVEVENGGERTPYGPVTLQPTLTNQTKLYLPVIRGQGN